MSTEHAGACALTRVTPGRDPGFIRSRTADGKGFTYADQAGNPPDAVTLARITALTLPPAWTDVWIAADPDGHIQAIGTDAKRRTQYRYHALWTGAEALKKFERALHLAAVLPTARRRNTKMLRHPDDSRARALAVAFRFLDDAAPRIGSITYLEQNGSRGLTTLQRRHATVDRSLVTLNFPGKEHQTDLLHMRDGELAAVVAQLILGDPGLRLLRYQLDGSDHDVSPAQVNTHIHAVTGGHFTAKDFRTVRGTIVAAKTLAEIGTEDIETMRHRAEVAAVKAAAEALANTPAVARSSYVDPRVFTAYENGRVLDVHEPPERAIRDLIEN